MNMTQHTIEASELREGDYLIGLDNGYVFDIDADHSISEGRYNAELGHGLLLVTYHTQNGDENYLLISPESDVLVGRDDA